MNHETSSYSWFESDEEECDRNLLLELKLDHKDGWTG